ncbi:probable chitinase 10 [Belonocnema kinseyi]|uniref:probable chitinase 10 n=1 Tax=Belonocnema kinseyi TaxID=2817044 RepID=UPI00143CE1EA|nr:probable chitinase 10 [Belonocnema kinseyi]
MCASWLGQKMKPQIDHRSGIRRCLWFRGAASLKKPFVISSYHRSWASPTANPDIQEKAKLAKKEEGRSTAKETAPPEMHKLILFLEVCSVYALGKKLPNPDKDCGKIIGCYAGDAWENVDSYALCSHVFYTSVQLEEDASVTVWDPYKDTEGRGFIQCNGLRKKISHLKTLLHMHDSYDIYKNTSHTKVLTDPKLRTKLVNNIIKFVKQYGFNGIDLDLSSPPQGHASEKENLVSLLKALKEKFDKEKLILTVLVDPIEETAKILYDIKEISALVSFINLKTYDFHGSADDKKVGHSAPLYHSSKENAEERKINIDSIVKYWISAGAPPNKLLLGTAFHAMISTLVNPKQIEQGQESYGFICKEGKDPKWKHRYDKEQKVPYLYSKNQIVTYEDKQSIKEKAEYAHNMNLGGVMVHNLGDDDFDGNCGEKMPLLKILHQIFRNKC